MESLHNNIEEGDCERVVHGWKKYMVEVQDFISKLIHTIGLQIRHEVRVLFKFLLIFDLKKTFLKQFI